jgi:hypothetical protein
VFTNGRIPPRRNIRVVDAIRLATRCDWIVGAYLLSELAIQLRFAVLSARHPEADMTSLLQDLRFAVRQIQCSPGFAVTAVLILAIGIAANVIGIGILQLMILRPLDVPNPDRVMTFAPHVADYPIFAYPEVRDVRDGNTVFSAVAALCPRSARLTFDVQ